MSFSRRGRPLAEEEKSTDAAKARARAMELLAGQELSSGQLYERLGRKFTQPTAASSSPSPEACTHPLPQSESDTPSPTEPSHAP